MRKLFVFGISATGLLAIASAADAATFNVLKAGTSDLIGTFDAPETGGLLTSASLTVKGVVYDVLGTGSAAPVFLSVAEGVTGFGAIFGSVFNSLSADTTDFVGDPISCGALECAFSFEKSFFPGPGSWYTDQTVLMAALGTGHYYITPAAVPLPATSALMLSGLLTAGAVVGRRRR